MDNSFHIPQFPMVLNGTFWGITAFFNPINYRNKVDNYRKFRTQSKKQGLNLICVEMAFGDAPFELTKDDADILVQVRSNSIMWQKERLLNIGLKHLPQECDKVAWIDCDLIFKNDNWIQETKDLLEKYVVIQPFSFVTYMHKNQKSENFHEMAFGLADGHFFYGTAYAFSMVGSVLMADKIIPRGNPGICWASRREVIDKCGFFDSCIFGSNDGIMMYAFYGVDAWVGFSFFSGALKLKQDAWRKGAFNFFKGSSFFIDGIVEHLWHGSLEKRDYATREKIGREYDFDPDKDISINNYGCFEWATPKIEMHKSIYEYFLQRQEE